MSDERKPLMIGANLKKHVDHDLRCTVGKWIALGRLDWSSAYPFLNGMELDAKPYCQTKESMFLPLHERIMRIVKMDRSGAHPSNLMYSTMARMELIVMHFNEEEQKDIWIKLSNHDPTNGIKAFDNVQIDLEHSYLYDNRE